MTTPIPDPKVLTQADYRARIQRAIYWLERHQDDDIDPADLARVAAFSVYHFHRVFRGVTGESVMACLRRLRLERAARSLRHTSAPIIEVALDAHYTSHEAFSRAFKKHFDQTPRQFRREPVPQRVKALAHPPTDLPEVCVRQSPTISYVCARYHQPFDHVQRAWQEFTQALMVSAPRLLEGAQLIGRYFDDPEITPRDKQRFDVGMVYTPGQPVPRGCFVSEIPAGHWAVTLHEGAYDTLTQTYLRLIGHWFPQSSYELGAIACVERYLNLPHDTPAAQLKTEVWAPIA